MKSFVVELHAQPNWHPLTFIALLALGTTIISAAIILKLNLSASNGANTAKLETIAPGVSLQPTQPAEIGWTGQFQAVKQRLDLALFNDQPKRKQRRTFKPQPNLSVLDEVRSDVEKLAVDQYAEKIQPLVDTTTEAIEQFNSASEELTLFVENSHQLVADGISQFDSLEPENLEQQLRTQVKSILKGQTVNRRP